MTVTKKLWAYEDAHNWGNLLHRAAKARGYDARLFAEAREPDEGIVFVHMHHHPQVRLKHKRMMAAMQVNPALHLIPDYQSSVLYDDKLEQARVYREWMPRTRIFHTPGSSKHFLNTQPKYPFMSKTAEGAGSHNVRLINNAKDAQDEIRDAFSDIGIKCKYGQEQRGYVLWQELVPGNAGDIRIIAIGDQRLILKRANRPDKPMASGSGNTKPVTVLDAEAATALQFANRFFDAFGLKWCGIDLVMDHAAGEWRLLETTVGWTMTGYYDCNFINRDGTVTDRKGDQVWQVLLDEIERGAFANVA